MSKASVWCRVICITKAPRLPSHYWTMTSPASAEPTEIKRLYTRRLPSGGYVAIEAREVRTLFGPVKIRGELTVERRSESRREGHRAPIAACAERSKLREIIDALFPIAHSDQAIAHVLSRNVMVSVATGRKPVLV